MTIRPIEELVTDRTLQDVNQKRTKGNWNIEDLNRIGLWQTYIRDLLNEAGYYVNITPKTDFVKSDLTNMTTKVNKIKTDTKALKDAFFTLQEYELNIGATSVNYVIANNIEKILFDMEYLVESMGTYFVHCGVANCGQNKVWQRRFRPRRTWNSIVFNTFGSLLEWITFENVSVVNDSEVDGISKYNDVYATLVYQNNKYNEIDDLVGGIDVNN